MYDMLPIEGEGEEKGAGAGGSSLQNLHAMVVGVSHDDAPVAVNGDAAKRVDELSGFVAEAADGANMGAVAVAQHLHAMVATFNNNNVAGGIERDARGISELARAFSFAADGADMLAVDVAQHLHTMVGTVGNNKVAFAVKRNTIVRRPIIMASELPVAAALAADGADVGAVAQPKHLHTSVAAVKNSNVALAVDGDAGSTVELSFA